MTPNYTLSLNPPARPFPIQPVVKLPVTDLSIQEEGLADCTGLLFADKLPHVHLQLQLEDIQYIHKFFTSPFHIAGTLTLELKKRIKHELFRSQDPHTTLFCQLPFLQDTKEYPFSTEIILAECLLEVLGQTGGQRFKIIGGEARTILAAAKEDAYYRMTGKKGNAPRFPRPDMDLILALIGHSYEQLLSHSEIIPNLITRKLFPHVNEKLFPCYVFLVKKVICRTPEILNTRTVATGATFGTPGKQKIDLNFVSVEKHNQIFEFNSLGIWISKQLLEYWLRQPSTSPQLTDPFLPEIDLSNDPLVNGLQATYDYINGIMRCSHPNQVNEKGVTRYLYWLSRNFFCFDEKIFPAFYETFKKESLRREEPIAAFLVSQIIRSHESHNLNDKALLTAMLFNALVLFRDNTEIVSALETQFKSHLQRGFKHHHHLFHILQDVLIQENPFSERILDWIQACAPLSPNKVKARSPHQFQLSDYYGLCFPNTGTKPLLRLLSQDIDQNAFLTTIQNRLFDDALPSKESLDCYTPTQKENLRSLAKECLAHPLSAFRRLGYRLLFADYLNGNYSLFSFLVARLPFFLKLEPENLHKQLSTHLSVHLGSCLTLPMGDISIFDWIKLILKTGHKDHLRETLVLWRALCDKTSKENASRQAFELLEIVIPMDARKAWDLFVEHAHFKKNEHEFIKILQSACNNFKNDPGFVLTLLKKQHTYLSGSSPSQKTKGRGKHHSIFLDALEKIKELYSKDALLILNGLLNHDYLQQKNGNVHKLIYFLAKGLTHNEALSLWEKAENYGCPLSEHPSPERCEFLFSLCSGLVKERHAKAAQFLNLLIKETLTEEQKNSVSEWILTLCQHTDNLTQEESSPLMEFLPPLSQADLAIQLILKAGEESKKDLPITAFSKIWPHCSEAQKHQILAKINAQSRKWLKELNTLIHVEKRGYILRSLPVLLSELNFAVQFNDDRALTDVSVALWGEKLTNALDGTIWLNNSLPPDAKGHIHALWKSLTWILINRKCYGLACMLLNVCYYHGETTLDEDTANLIIEANQPLINVRDSESCLAFWRLYRFPVFRYVEQLSLYSRLINRLIEIQSSQIGVWMMRTLAFAKPATLPAELVVQWLTYLSAGIHDRRFIGNFYAYLDKVQPADQCAMAEIYRLIATRSESSIIAASIFIEHHTTLSYFPPSVLDPRADIFINQLILQNEAKTFSLIGGLLEIYTISSPHTWSNVFQCIGDAEEHNRLKAWTLLQKAILVGAFANHPKLKTQCALNALKAMKKAPPAFFDSLIANLDTFCLLFDPTHTDEKMEGLSLLFAYSIEALILIMDLDMIQKKARYLTDFRFSLKELPPWCPLDEKIIEAFIRESNIHLFQAAIHHMETHLQKTGNPELNKRMEYFLGAIKNEQETFLVYFSKYVETSGFPIDPFPIIKRAASVPSQKVRTAVAKLAGLTLTSYHTPTPTQKLILKCFILKLIDDETIVHVKYATDIIKNPDSCHWFTPQDFSLLHERISLNLFKIGLTTDSNPVAAVLVAFKYFRGHYSSFPLNAAKMNQFIDLGVKNLIRLIKEGQENDLVCLFHTETLFFLKTLFNLQISSAPIEFSDPVTPERSSLRALSLSPAAASKTPQHPSHIISKARRFESIQEFLSFIVHDNKSKDEKYSPELVYNGVDQESIKRACLDFAHMQVKEEVIEEQSPSIESQDKILLSFESWNFKPESLANQKLYVVTLADILSTLCDVRTDNYPVRNYLVDQIARTILFLMKYYKDEHRDLIISLVDRFVFSLVAVDSLAASRKQMDESIDQEIYKRHNEWAGQILWELNSKWQLDSIQKPVIISALLKIYPLEIRVEIPRNEMPLRVAQTINRLLQSNSSIHYRRAIQLFSIYQNIFFKGPEDLSLHYLHFINKISQDPYYLFREKTPVEIRNEEKKEEYSPFNYIVKKPLCDLIGDLFFENHLLFPPKNPSKEFIEKRTQLILRYYYTLLEISEDPKFHHPHFNLLKKGLQFLFKASLTHAFKNDFEILNACLERAIPLALIQIGMSKNKVKKCRDLGITTLFEMANITNVKQRQMGKVTMTRWFMGLLDINNGDLTLEVQKHMEDYKKRGLLG